VEDSQTTADLNFLQNAPHAVPLRGLRGAVLDALLTLRLASAPQGSL
jgi:hypothetical protein